MGDIDFEEQLKLEKLEKERIDKGAPKERVDPDGTVYEWDYDKNAWFPKIDENFIAQYQMNYGSQSGVTEESGSTDTQTETQKYYEYYQNYYDAEAQHEALLNKKNTKEAESEDTHDEAVGKLEALETKIQSGTADELESDSKEVMEKYTEEQKKEYNDYWSYYYGTDYHDYYTDCMAQSAESMEGNTDGKKEEEKSKDGKKKGKKRKAATEPKKPETWFEMEEKDNTNVYVTGLPHDITTKEFTEMMNKYGLIMFDPRTKKPKVKLYIDENGQPKGDGRCCYIKRESVDLALNLLDGSELRGSTITVDLAKFEMKGNFDPTKKKKKLTNKEKNRRKERQEQLFDWRPDKPRGARLKHEKVVILKNVFDPKTFEENPALISSVSSDVRSECSKYGDVKKVTVYDRHEDGVVMVTFAEAEEADMCIEYMNQRYLAQRRLLAETWDGTAKYEVIETEAEKEERLNKWQRYLDGKDDEVLKEDKTNSTKDSSVDVLNSKTVDKTEVISDVVKGNHEDSTDKSVDKDVDVPEVKTAADEDESVRHESENLTDRSVMGSTDGTGNNTGSIVDTSVASSETAKTNVGDG